jgi:purine-nucleoside phosphorylase
MDGVVMADPVAPFTREVNRLSPRTAVVVGSGLAGVTAGFSESASITFADIPGLVSPTVHGHTGRIAIGEWEGAPVLIFFGRLHFYEGNTWGVITAPVRLAAKLGVKVIVLTNAAGGIHPLLGPGSLMAIRDHLTLLDRDDWRRLAAGATPCNLYTPSLISRMQHHEVAAGRELLVGTYAGLTGPCYETPAEIRALRACGADAVGMSTAKEAEAAAGLGLEVAAVSCVTNWAAGLSDISLTHTDVLANAKLAVGRLGGLLRALVCQGPSLASVRLA